MRNRKKSMWKRIAAGVLAVLMCLNCEGITTLAAGSKDKANSIESAEAVTIQLKKTEGTVTVSNASGKSVKLVKNMRLFDGYQVSTEEKSYAWAELDKSKLVKADAASEAEIRKKGKVLEVLLKSGNLFFNVTEPLEDDETMNICTSSMIAGIRGTCGWVRVIDTMCTRIYLLEGVLECVVTDPVTGQSKVTLLKGGECADFYVYDKRQAGDKCDIIRDKFKREDVPGFVLVELSGDRKRCEEIFADSGIDLRSVTAKEARERLKEDEKALEEPLQELEKQVAKQEKRISHEPVWTILAQKPTPKPGAPTTAPTLKPGSAAQPAPSGTAATNPSATAAPVVTQSPAATTAPAASPTPAATIAPTASPTPAATTAPTASPTPAATSTPTATPTPTPKPVQNMDIEENPGAVEESLSEGSDVVIASNSTSNVYRVDSDLHIPAGSTLAVEDDLTMVVGPAATVTVDGTLLARGNIENSGTIIINSGESVHVTGSFINNGVIINQRSGLVDATAGIDNYGDITCDGESTLRSNSAEGTVRMFDSGARLVVSGGNITNQGSGAALALEEASQIGNVTFTTATLLQSVSENVLTVGGKKLAVENYDVSHDQESNYFQFKIEIWNVVFDGGEGSTVKDRKVITGFPVGSGVPVLSRSGYDLVGWNTEADGSGETFTKDTVVTADRTVYAQWKENPVIHTITLNAGEGSLSGENSLKVLHNEKPVLPTPSAPSGYAFHGWYTAADSTGARVNDNDPVVSDCTYYARWIPVTSATKWEVRFAANDGTGAETAVEYVVSGNTVTAPAEPIREGYSFGGWYTDEACGTAYDFDAPVKADLTLYAKWTVRRYTVTFSAGAGASTVEAQTVDHGTVLTKPADPVKMGYTFVGWYKDAALTEGNTWDFANDKVTGTMILYAKWEINRYTVTVDANGGSAVASQSVDHQQRAAEPTAPTREGYSFDGWYRDTDYLEVWDFAVDTVTEDITLYARWSVNGHTVTFRTNGGSAVASQNAEHGGKVSEPVPEPTRTGYTFAGWYKDAALTEGNTWDFATDTVTGPTILYAKWTVNRYTTTFSTGAGASTVEAQTVDYDTVLTKPADPTKTGYTFAGWYKDAALTEGNTWDFANDKVTGTMILYAKWNINSYTVSFDSDGGSTVASQTVEYQQKVSEPTAPTKTGYTFAGWYKESTLATAWDFANDKVTETTMLYAKWNINSYTVSFDSDGGSAVASQSIEYQQKVSEPTAPTKTGYTFAGWYKDAALTDGNTWDFAADTVTGATTLYAKWTVNRYTTTFSTGAGASTVEAQTVDYNTVLTKPADPTKTGYTFAGWYKDAALTDGNTWNFTTDTVTGATTLYAKWNINSYMVSFDSDGGSAVASQTVEYQQKVSEPTAPTKTGYTFAGWYKDAALTEGNTWDFAADTVTGATTLYAKWTVNRYTTTFSTGAGASTVEAQTVDYDTVLTKPADPTKTGYTFAGWYKDAALTDGNTWDFANDKVTGTMILYAKWNINSYTVSFDSDGGSVVASQSIEYQQKVSEPTAPTKTGYTFAGWYKDAALTAGNTWDFAADTVTGATTLYAKWTVNRYTTTFSTGAGASTVEAQTVDYDTVLTKPADPTKTGYTFGGWYKDAALTDGNTWDFANDKVTGTMILYAKWNINSYTVSFDSDGGSAVASQSIEYQQKVSEPTAPTKAGYTFAGWYKDAALTAGNTWDFAADTVTGATTLYAKWTPATYTVTLNANSGVIASGKDVTGYTYGVGATLPVAADMSRTGYDFDGWYAKADFSDSAVTGIGTTETGDKTYYAKWTPTTYTVTLNANSGAIASGKDVTGYTYGVGATLPVAADMSRTGYDFDGWYAKADFSDSAVTGIGTTETGDKTYYAKWTPATYTVTLNANSGTIASGKDVTDYTYGVGATLPAVEDMTRARYIFDGWYAKADFSDSAVTEIGATETGDKVYYAKWARAYTVTFSTGTGASAVEEQSVKENGKATRPAADPTKDRFEFAGWYRDENCTTEYDFADAVTGDITIYAKWTPAPLNLTLSAIQSNFALLTDALNSGDYTTINITDDGSGANTLTVSGSQSLTVPAGVTLNLKDGISLNNEGPVTVNGTLNVSGSIANESDIIVTSGQSLHVTGTITNSAEATLQATGEGLIEAAGIVNNGGIRVENSKCRIIGTITNNGWVLDQNALEIAGDDATKAGALWQRHNADITSVTVKGGVTVIHDGAFNGCTKITAFNFAHVTSVGLNVFSGCTQLVTLSVAADNTAYKVVDNVLYDKGGSALVLCPAGRSGEFEVPDSVTAIRAGAFADCTNLAKIALPATVTTIASGAFSNSQAIECDGKASEWADRLNGTGIASDKITYTHSGDVVNGIVWDLNRKTGKMTIGIGQGSSPAAMEDYRTNGSTPWSDDRDLIRELVIEEGVTSIGSAAFYNCKNLASVSIGGDVTVIGDYAFLSCDSLKEIVIPDNVLTLGDSTGQVFSGSGLESVTIGKGVTTIESSTFSGCENLSTVTFAEDSNLQKIGSDAFRGCSSLTKIAIPETVSEIGSDAFYKCTKLAELTFGEHSRLTTLGEYAFSDCSSLTGTLTIPGSLSECGRYVFCNCTGLTGVIFEDGVQEIGNDMFAGCTGLKGELVIPGSVTMINASAFDRCTGLTGVTIEENSSGASQTIGESFWYCTGITQVTIPKTARNIYGAFKGCSSLERIVLDPANEDYYLCDGVLCAKRADANSRIWLVACPAKKTGAFVMPDDITDVREGAFSCCTGLTELTIGKNVSNTSRDVFEGLANTNPFKDLISLTAFKVATGNGRYSAEDGVLYDRNELTCCPISKEGAVTVKDGTGTVHVNSASYHAFTGCSKVTSISVPASFGGNYEKFLIYKYLKDCTSLEEINVAAGNKEYYSADGIVYTADMKELYYCPPAKNGIDETKIPLVLSSIRGDSFHGSRLTALPIRKTVDYIGVDAFADSSIRIINYAGSKEQWEAINNYDELQGITVNYNAAIAEPPAVLVDSGECGATGADTVKWELYDNGKLIFSGNGNMKDYAQSGAWVYLTSGSVRKTNAPWSEKSFTQVIFEDGVTGIGKYAFTTISLKNVTFGNGIKTIGESAFENCYALGSVTVTGNQVEIGKNAFKNCLKLSQITISDQVAVIGDYAFQWCGALESLTIAGSQLEIGQYAFGNCTALPQVTISDQVVSIGYGAFSACTQLADLIFEENSSLTTIGRAAFSGCLKLSGDIVIPDSVTSIGERAFFRGTGEQNGEWRVTIPVSVTSIGKNAFATTQSYTLLKLYYKGNKIQWSKVALGEDWNVINSDNIYWKSPLDVTFQGPAGEYGSGTCGDSQTWTLYDTPSLVISGTGAMKDYSGSDKAPWNALLVSLKNTMTDKTLKAELDAISVVIENGVTSIGDYAFCDGAYMKEITISESVESVGRMAFSGCGNLKELTLPAAVTTIGAGAFNNCVKLSTAFIPAGVVNLDLSAYDGCTKLEQFEVAAGNTAFRAEDGILFNKSGTELMRYPIYKSGWEYTIPEGVTTIAGGAFKNLDTLYKITIPKNVTTIGDGAFQGKSYSIFYLGTEEEWETNVSFDPSKNQISGNVHCSAGTIDLGGGNKLKWAMDGDGRLTISGAGAIPDYESYGNTAPWYSSKENITNVVIGEGITAIGNYAFYYSYNLQTVTLPAGLERIGDNAFNECYNLEEITLPTSLTVIGDSAFSGCGLEEITLPTGLTAIGNSAFYGCSGLEEITLPAGLTAIGDYTFYNCRGLTEITIPAKVETIGEYAFSGEFDCDPSMLERVIFEEGSQLTTIGGYAFYGCSSLTEIAIPATVTTIGEYAFSGDEYSYYGSSGLASVTFAAGSRLESIGEYAFAGAKLTSVEIPAGVTKIESSAFYYCQDLASVTFAAGSQVKTIGDSAFCGCSGLTAITIPASVTDIEGAAFRNSGLTAVEIPAGVTTVGAYVFDGCSSLASVTFAAGCRLEEIPCGMFYDCTALKELPIPAGVTKIGDSAFYGSGLTSVTISGSVTEIGSSAFYDCTDLQSVVIEEGVTAISGWMFSGCTSLTSVTIPKSVKNIERCAFNKCSSLADVYYAGTEEEWGKINIDKYTYSGGNNAPLTSTSVTKHYNYTSGG